MKRLAEVSYKRYIDKGLSKEEYKHLLDIDPTAPDYKFGDWIINNYLKLPEGNRPIFMRDQAGKVNEWLTYVINLPKGEAPQNFTAEIKTYADLKKFVDQKKSKFGTTGQQVIPVPKNEYKILYEDDEWILVQVFTHRSSRFWGKPDICDGQRHTDATGNEGYIFCTTWASPSNWNSFWKEDLNPLVAYLKHKDTEDIWAFVKNDHTNQYQDKRNHNPSGNSIEDLNLERFNVPDEALEIIEDMFPSTPIYSIESYADAQEDDYGILTCRVTYSLNRAYPDGDIEYIKGIGSEFIIADFGSDSYSDLSENEDWAKVVESCDGTFNLNNGNGFYVKVNSKLKPHEVYEEAGSEWRNADNINSYDWADTSEIEYECRETFTPRDYDYIIFDGFEFYEDDWIENFLKGMNRSLKKLRTEDSIDIGENLHIYYMDTYDYAPNTNEWVTTDWQRRKDRQLDLPFGF